jgi:F420-dependent oxidoreductase-like protein
VVEGWHGVAFGKPLSRTREYIEIVRQAFARQGPLEHRGKHYRIPYDGPGATGLGKPLKSILHPEPLLNIYTAAISPAGLKCAGEVADGVQPIFMSPEQADVVVGPVAEGLAKAGGGKSLGQFDIAPFVRVAMGQDVQACRDALKPELALYIGGMGARQKNFYNDYAVRLGYEAAAAEIQEAFLDGRRGEAIGAVPDALVDEISLVGPPERIRERLTAWQAAARQDKVGTLLLGGAGIEALRVIAEAVL